MRLFISSLLFLQLILFSCQDPLREEFCDLWVEGVLPDCSDIEYYEFGDYYIVSRTDYGGDQFIVNQDDHTAKIQIFGCDDASEERSLQFVIDFYEMLKTGNEIIHVAHCMPEKVELQSSIYPSPGFYKSYTFRKVPGDFVLEKVLRWDPAKKCYCLPE